MALRRQRQTGAVSGEGGSFATGITVHGRSTRSRRTGWRLWRQFLTPALQQVANSLRECIRELYQLWVIQQIPAGGKAHAMKLSKEQRHQQAARVDAVLSLFLRQTSRFGCPSSPTPALSHERTIRDRGQKQAARYAHARNQVSDYVRGASQLQDAVHLSLGASVCRVCSQQTLLWIGSRPISKASEKVRVMPCCAI